MSGPTFLEVKVALTGERHEFPCAPLTVTDNEVIILHRLPREGHVEDLVLPTGTLSLGYFWVARPYNVYHWLTPDGRMLGLYFNISDGTRITPGQVVWRDLVVDVLITPDGRCRVLDENELPIEIGAALRQQIGAVRDELVRQHESLLAEIETKSSALLRELRYSAVYEQLPDEQR